MNSGFQIETFLPAVTGRADSLFAADIEANRAPLSDAIGNASVLAIGGAGTIGASFVKSLLAFGPRKVVVLDSSENALAEQIRDLRSTHGLQIPADFITYPVSFADPVAAKIIPYHGPFDIVANFAAHKHVRSEKDIFSIEAMLENNVFRARRFMDTVTAMRPRHTFAVSTDKAANPANIMGASKKLMEQMLLAYAQRMPVTTARFANVAFSNGSLLQAFLERMGKGQPLSAPNDVRRYFVSPQESGQICMAACVLGGSGEIFFPKLNEATHARTFSDIAIDLLHRLKLQPRVCKSEDEARAMAAARRPDDTFWPVYFFGSDTDGEKPLEEFHVQGERLDLQRFAALGVVQPGEAVSGHDVFTFIDALAAQFRSSEVTKESVVQALRVYFGEFAHLETGKSLDARM